MDYVLAGEFKRDELKKAIEIIHQAGKKAYVSVNAIFHNEHIDDLVDLFDIIYQH